MAIGRLDTVNVLVVEDDSFVQKVISQVLANINVASVVVAGSGKEAFRHLGDADSSFDIIICDIEMPGMNGFEFTRRVRYGEVQKYKHAGSRGDLKRRSLLWLA